MDWKPINSAPKDGTRFLAWITLVYDEYDENDVILRKGAVEKYVGVAQYIFGSIVEVPYRGTFVQNMRFTHWAPLPAGPEPRDGR